ncbi:amidohydrolase family protein [Burkholderia thailandensis MSMB121]|nr:amidohydrolase family protein [Burkholderia humptydooensis]AGK46108.1 amidohydrolase family protein [Burkholderia thailandensis MSMB121]ATF36867.1 amidohydrolase [Burkholderia thailandensis]KST74243.1 amidohydrolase [Burkholderia humptydooensis]
MNDDILYAGIEYLDPGTCRLATADIRVKDGRFHSIRPAGAPRPDGVATADGTGRVMFPGLVNAHLHPSKELYGDLHDFSPIQTVLDSVHKNNRLESAQTQYAAALYSIMRNVRSGVTSVGVFTSRFETDADACKAVGVRASVQFCQSDQWLGGGSKPSAYGIDEIIRRYERSVDTHATPLIDLQPATASELSASDDLIRQLHGLAKARGKTFSMHVHEGRTQVKSFRDAHGISAIRHLGGLGVLDEHLTLVHASSVDDDDVAEIRRSRANLVHCPISNSFVGAGRMPVRRFAGVRHMGLGTDAAMVNPENRLTNDAMFCLYHHGEHDLDDKLSAAEVLGMLTASGGESIGLRGIGAIRAGRRADFIVFRRDRLTEAYGNSPISHLRLLRNENPDQVFVDGRAIFSDGTFAFVDFDEWRSRFEALREEVTA